MLNEKEVDFVTGDVRAPLPIEAKYISSFEWNDRRFAGMRLFLRRFPRTRKALLITKTVDTDLKSGHAEIEVVPLWRFLLSPDSYLQT